MSLRRPILCALLTQLAATAAMAAEDSHTGRFVGVGSCASSACHGGDRSTGIRGSEYSIWIDRDPHARARSILYGDDAQRIARNYLPAGTHAADAHACLACHATGAHGVDARPTASNSGLADGVGCESCHGPAAGWRATHTQRGWAETPMDVRRELGFNPTKDLLNRAHTCVGCHVGEPGREVNHDLIAAGHPRLYFEFSAFLANMPAHWDRKAERERDQLADAPGRSCFETRAWLVGQVVSAQAAARLLETRAQHAAPDVDPEKREQAAVWPEFSEYNCYACHHALRSEHDLFPVSRGQPRWGAWYFANFERTPHASMSRSLPVAVDLSGPVKQLSRLMAASTPGAMEVANQAGQLRVRMASLATTAATTRLTRTDLATLEESIAEQARTADLSDWDRAAQFYLAAVALQLDKASGPRTGAAPQSDALEILRVIRHDLAFPERTNSPGRLNRTTIEDLRRRFEQLR